MKSRKGRDVTRLYVALGGPAVREGRQVVLLANGGKWTLAAPKEKNLRHIQPTKTVLPKEEMETDQQIKAALCAMEERVGTEPKGG